MRLGIAFGSCVLAVATAAFADMRVASEGTTHDGGIDLHWSVTAGDDPGAAGFGLLDVMVSDSLTGAAISYENGALLGWLQRTRTALVEQDQTCADRVVALATQGIGQKGDIDLNGYRIVTLNSDGSMAFINPYVGFNNAKLESIIDLHARPVDWVQVHDRMEYWVLLTDPGRLVAVDLQTRRVTETIDLPKAAGATRLMADAAEQRLWVALPGTGQIGTVDLRAADHRLKLTDAKGIARLFGTSDGAVLGWSDGAGLVTLLTEGKQRATMDDPVAIVHSTNAAATLVASADGRIESLSDDGGAVTEIAVGHPIRDMRLFDGDRRVLVVGDARASVVDLATRTVSMSFRVEPGASQIALTERYAYVLGAASGRASMIALEDLIRARPQVLDIIVSAATAQKGSAPISVVPVPEGDGLLVSSAVEGMIYHYSEGMMAPSGSYSNYRRAPVGIGIVDYALREVETGHYRAALRIEAGGRYDLILGGIGPRVSSCARVLLAGDPSMVEQNVARINATLVSATAKTDGSRAVQVSVQIVETLPDQAGSRTISGLGDLKLLVFDKRTGWQRRITLVDAGDGTYQADLPLPRKSRYELLASSATANLSYVEGQMGEQLLGVGP